MKKWVALILMSLLVILDQVTKYFAKINLEGKSAFVIWDNVFELSYLKGGNTGAAFGIFQGKTFLLSFISLICFFVIVGFYLYINRHPDNNKWLSVCLVFLASGALGNWIDRFFREYVIDFLYFKAIDFPVFNLADCYVTVSAIALFVIIAFSKDEKESAEGKEL